MTIIAKVKSSLNQIYLRLQNNWSMAALVLLILIGFLVRMIDLKDPPVDFHPTRQLRGGIIARNIYFLLDPPESPSIAENAFRASQAVTEREPPILETIVALGYLAIGDEQIWISRIVTSLFWVLAAIPLYEVANRLGGKGAALIASSFYLFWPFSIQASRSFQPDPLMISLFILTIYSAFRWSKGKEWRWAIITGICSAIAILIKVFAAYFLFGALAATVLSTFGLRKGIVEKQVWAVLLISLIPASSYYFLLLGDTPKTSIQNLSLALLPLLAEPFFYVRWMDMLTDLLELSILMMAFLGVIISSSKRVWIVIGAWLGYFLYGLTLPHHIITHNYFHLVVVPLAAFSMAPAIGLVVEKNSMQKPLWRVLFVFIIIIGFSFSIWTTRNDMLAINHQEDARFWQSVGQAIPSDGETIALTQAYGTLLMYYGDRPVKLWPVTSEAYLADLRNRDFGDLESHFLRRTKGIDYFIITSFNQLEKQPELGEYLHANYPIYSQGAGFLIYDLR